MKNYGISAFFPAFFSVFFGVVMVDAIVLTDGQKKKVDAAITRFEIKGADLLEQPNKKMTRFFQELAKKENLGEVKENDDGPEAATMKPEVATAIRDYLFDKLKPPLPTLTPITVGGSGAIAAPPAGESLLSVRTGIIGALLLALGAYAYEWFTGESEEPKKSVVVPEAKKEDIAREHEDPAEVEQQEAQKEEEVLNENGDEIIHSPEEYDTASSDETSEED